MSYSRIDEKRRWSRVVEFQSCSASPGCWFTSEMGGYVSKTMRVKAACVVLVLCFAIPALAHAATRTVYFSGAGVFSTAPLGSYNMGRQVGYNSGTNSFKLQLYYCTLASMPNPIVGSTLYVSPGRVSTGAWLDPVPWNLYWRTKASAVTTGNVIAGWARCETQ